MAGETSPWIRFFENAGLPPKIALKYAMLFLDHRIQRNMLGELTKSILNEVGITAVGDVLAILKQAKIEANTDEVEMKETAQKVALIVPSERSPPKAKAVVPVAARLTAAPKATIVVTTVAPSPTKRLRRQSAPDHDVEYRVNMPKGTTERSRQLLKKAASNKSSSSQKSVFDRLGAVVKTKQEDMDDDDDEEGSSGRLSAVPSRLRKSVSFACGTKESSPEVSSTTGEYDGRLESDKMARKVSALQRLGSKPPNEIVRVVGERRLLVAKRTTPVKPKSIFERLG